MYQICVKRCYKIKLCISQTNMSETITECKIFDKESIENFVAKQLKLLEIERDAEIEENK